MNENPVDRELIRQLIMTYAIEGDRGRMEYLVACFAEDGILEMTAWSRQGRAEIAKQLSGGYSETPIVRPKFARHHITSTLIELQSAREAAGRTYFLVITDMGPDHAGVYVDRFRQIDGSWLIAHRQTRIDWVAEGSTYRSRLLPMIPRR